VVNFLKQVALQRKRVIRDLMPDRCTITPSTGANMVISAGGIPTTEEPQPRTWVNPFITGFTPTTEIPCRVDPSRSQQPDRLKAQTVVVDQYYLELPYNVVIVPTDRVTVNNHVYEIVKLDLQGAMSLTTVALITELSAVIDA
jgi:hypothetical protein